jgi:hypothetical protein
VVDIVVCEGLRGFYKCVLALLEFFKTRIMACESSEETLELFQSLMKDEVFVNSEFVEFLNTHEGHLLSLKYPVQSAFVVSFKQRVAQIGISKELLAEIEGLYDANAERASRSRPDQ